MRRAITVVMWWPIGTPIPEGWRVAERQMKSHHHFWSILLVKVTP